MVSALHTPRLGAEDALDLRPRRTLRSRAAAALGVALYAVLNVFAPHRASVSRLAEMPFTVAGLGCVDFAAFHLPHGWGWLVTGLSLILLEYLIADEAGDGR